MTTEYKIKPENTAIAGNPTTSARMLVEDWAVETEFPITVLDYGCGKLRNSELLRDEGFSVTCHDTPDQIARVKPEEKGFRVSSDFSNNSYPLVLCSYVLNVVTPEIRKSILQDIKNAMADLGYAYIEVRSEVGAKYKVPHLDGWVVGKNDTRTFQRSFTVKELVDLLESEGFQIQQTTKTGHSSIAIVTKR